MALTATCPWNVMKDVMKILGLRQPQMPRGTLVYSAPLHRMYYIYNSPCFDSKGLHVYSILLYQILGPNLVYQVVKRPDTMEETIQHMAKYILKNYRGQSGIIYCFSKKDTETVSMDLYNQSKGQIVCEIYHADLTLVCVFIYISIKKLNE